MSVFSKRLKDTMKQKGYRQVDVIRLVESLADGQNVKLGKSHLSQYISGKTTPRRDVLNALAAVLEVSPEWLYGTDDTTLTQPEGEKVQKSSITFDITKEYRKDVDNMELPEKRVFTKSKKLDHVLYDVRGPVLEAANKMEAEGTHILKLNIGNPAPFGFRTPDEVIYDMRQQLPDCEGYSDSKGLFSARKAIMQYAQLKNIPNVTIQDVYTGNGVSELISLCMQALLDEGDEILIPSPDYPLWTGNSYTGRRKSCTLHL